MTWRKKAPEPLVHAGRSATLAWGRATSRLRSEPDFIIAGAQRCGTTSLFRALMSHPQVARPVLHKGVNYFDINYIQGWDWYLGHFPVASLAAWRTRATGPTRIFEASGYYLYHPFAIARLARDLPEVKVVVMLRDPVERAYSAYQHELMRGYEWESFETALDLEPERLVGEVERMRRDPGYESFSHRHHSYLHRGHYAEQLENVFANIPRERVHVLLSEDFFADPTSVFSALADFLGLVVASGLRFDQYNAQPRVPMAADTEQRLREYYAPHDQALATLLGRVPTWAR